MSTLSLREGGSFVKTLKSVNEQKEKMKYEIAEELGLLEKVQSGGWKSLTSKETGRIGGLMTKRSREQKLEK